MKKLLGYTLLLMATCGIPLTSSAEDLLQIYRQALHSDPTFKAAAAEYLAAKENVPINRAALLPNLNLSGTSQRQQIRQTSILQGLGGIPVTGRGVVLTDKGERTDVFDNTSNDYTLLLSQPIFDYGAWMQLAQANFQVKQAAATYAAAAQDLMLRTAQAYFGVLQASDNLRYTQAQKKAVGEQLKQTQQQYDVGLVAITGIKEAQANYDSLVAQEIAAKNDLSNAIEQLRTITGRTYPYLMGANDKLPLVSPNPSNINRWVEVAQTQNYDLVAAINAANAAQENIKVQQAGHLPVVDAIGSYNYDNESNPNDLGMNKSQVTGGGISLNFPIYEGGLVIAQTRQAGYLYQQAISQMEFTHRGVIQQTRDSYLGVMTGIGKIRADKENIISQEASLKATQEGYMVGTRTILDVLLVQSSLYQAQKQYSLDQYNYLTSILSLKQAAATLSPDDIAEINSWLKQPVEIANRTGYSTEVPYINPRPDKGICKPKYKKTLHDKPELPRLHPDIDFPNYYHSTSQHKAIYHTSAATSYSNNYYVLVLFDGRVPAHAENFIQQQNLNGKAKPLTVTNTKGQRRYLVVYGHYNNIQAAQHAATRLPAKQFHPWIKKV